MSTDGAPTETEPSRAVGMFSDQPLSGGDAREINRLSEQVEALKDKLGEVIFIACCVVVIIADLCVLPNSQTWAAPLVIGVIEIIFLYMIARVCRVNDITKLTALLLDGIDRYKGNRKPSDLTPTDQA